MTHARPAATHLLGDGYEPHVDEIDGRLRYTIPVESGFVSHMFEYMIGAEDLAVLVDQPYRRIVLQHILHAVLQRSTLAPRRTVSQEEFRALLSRVLFSSAEELGRLIGQINREYHIHLQYYIAQDMARLGLALPAADQDSAS